MHKSVLLLLEIYFVLSQEIHTIGKQQCGIRESRPLVVGMFIKIIIRRSRSNDWIIILLSSISDRGFGAILDT